MSKKVLAAIAVAAVPMLYSAVASAGPVLTLTMSEAGFATVSQSSTTGTITYASTYGSFDDLDIDVGRSPPKVLSPQLTLNVQGSDDGSGGAGTLTITLTVSGLTSPLFPETLASGFTANYLDGGITASTISSFLNDQLLATHTFGTGTAQSYNKNTNPDIFTAPYSESLVMTITDNGSVDGGDISVTAAINQTAYNRGGGGPIPEPASLAILGSGLIVLAATNRRRRKTS